MATASEYAQWIINNADKKGTPEFQTVQNAYQTAKMQESKTEPNLTDSIMSSIKGGVNDIKELFPQNHEAYLKLREKLGNQNPNDPEVMKRNFETAQGFLPMQGVSNLAKQLFPQVAEKAASTASRTLPQWLMQSALKPNVKDLETGKAQQAINTLLEENVNPTQGSTIFGKGLDSLQDKVNVLNDQIKNIISTSNATISKSEVGNYLNNLKIKAAKQVNPEADLIAINKVEQEFAKYNKPVIETPTMPIPIQTAQELKSGTYKSLGEKAFGELKSSDINAQKELARGLKDKIAKAEPKVSLLNEAESKLLNALSVSERRALIEANKDMLGLTNMTRDAQTQLLSMMDRSAPVKALLARMIYRAQKLPSKVGGLLEKNIPLTDVPITTNPQEVIVPNILKGMGLLSQQQ